MTEEQRQHALALCDRILETAAKLQADLQGAAQVIEEEMQAARVPHSHYGSSEAAVRNP
jgi:hypothetical protein